MLDYEVLGLPQPWREWVICQAHPRGGRSKIELERAEDHSAFLVPRLPSFFACPPLIFYAPHQQEIFCLRQDGPDRRACWCHQEKQTSLLWLSVCPRRPSRVSFPATRRPQFYSDERSKKKIKCSGERPACINCRQAQRGCIYEPYSNRNNSTGGRCIDVLAPSALQSATSLQVNVCLCHDTEERDCSQIRLTSIIGPTSPAYLDHRVDAHAPRRSGRKSVNPFLHITTKTSIRLGIVFRDIVETARARL